MENTETTRITTKGQVVIPVGIRRHLKLSPGTELYVTVEHGRVILEPKPVRRSQLEDWKARNPAAVRLTTAQLCRPVTLDKDDRT